MKIGLLLAASALLCAGVSAPTGAAYARRKEQELDEPLARGYGRREPITLNVPPDPLPTKNFAPGLHRRRQAWDDPAVRERRAQLKRLLKPLKKRP